MKNSVSTSAGKSELVKRVPSKDCHVRSYDLWNTINATAAKMAFNLSFQLVRISFDISRQSDLLCSAPTTPNSVVATLESFFFFLYYIFFYCNQLFIVSGFNCMISDVFFFFFFFFLYTRPFQLSIGARLNCEHLMDFDIFIEILLRRYFNDQV